MGNMLSIKAWVCIMSQYLVLCKLGTGGSMLPMTIKYTKEDLFWVACKSPIGTDCILHNPTGGH